MTRLIKWHFTNIFFKLYVYKLINCCGLFSLTYCDWLFMILWYVLVLNDYLWCTYSLVLNFILKIFICFFFHNFFVILIKYDKKVDTINPFYKWVMLGLRNLNPFNKHVGLVLTYIVEYSWVNTTRTWHGNMNCHPYMQINSYRYIFLLNIDQHFILSHNQ